MQAREVKTIEDAMAVVKASGLSHIKVGMSDIDGVMRGKYISKEKFFSILTKLLESNVTQLNIRSPDAEKMK
jgi:glutamine synthetase